MDLTLTPQACVWFVDSGTLTDDRLEQFRAWLGADELQRYAGFLRPGRRRQFVLGRVLLRQCLAAVLSVPAREIRLVERPGDAPGLAWPENAEAGFSISHSGNWVACAASAGAKLGLDIERIDPARDIEALAAQAFDCEQQAWLAARPASSRVRDFYAMWSRLEARIKLGEAAAVETALFHPQFAAVLCSARPLAGTPGLHQVTLAT